jgi:flavodoxin
MKTLIVYSSTHKGNTEKVAKKIGEILGADLKKVFEVSAGDLANYDLIGFGSGIYRGKFHESMLKFFSDLPDAGGKKAFVFCTAFVPVKKFINDAAEELQKKNFEVVGKFKCRGYSDLSIMKYFAKGRPDAQDLDAAAKFAEGLK